jgi:hypothetical protein
MAEVLRKYIRYVLNERPFTPETVADLLHLRKVSGLSEPEVAEVLNDVAKRVVKAKGSCCFYLDYTSYGIKNYFNFLFLCGIGLLHMFLSPGYYVPSFLQHARISI